MVVALAQQAEHRERLCVAHVNAFDQRLAVQRQCFERQQRQRAIGRDHHLARTGERGGHRFEQALAQGLGDPGDFHHPHRAGLGRLRRHHVGAAVQTPDAFAARTKAERAVRLGHQLAIGLDGAGQARRVGQAQRSDARRRQREHQQCVAIGEIAQQHRPGRQHARGVGSTEQGDFTEPAVFGIALSQLTAQRRELGDRAILVRLQCQFLRRLLYYCGDAVAERCDALLERAHPRSLVRRQHAGFVGAAQRGRFEQGPRLR